MFDSRRVTTITFDSYSTLVDVDAAEEALAERVEDPEPIAELWRSRSLRYTFVSDALDANGADLSEDERDEVLSVYHDLDAFDDVRDGVERLRDGGYDCYVLSNGDPDMLASLVDAADVDDLIVDTISADEVRTFKPDAEVYRHAAGRTGTPIREIAHVTGGWSDVMGAPHAGMQAVRLDRTGAPWEPFDGELHLTVDTLHEFAGELGV